MKKKDISGKVVIIVVSVFGILCIFLMGLWWKGGIEPSNAYMDINTKKPTPFGAQLLYRGIKIPSTDEVLFKKYYAIAEKDEYRGLNTVVMYKRDGYNQFFIYFDKGGLAGHGQCMVETSFDKQILHDASDIKEATFYNVSGKVVSTVKEGSGTQILFSSEGQKYWELKLENYNRSKLTIWNKDGSVPLSNRAAT